ncbi:MAG: tRNA (5-methylaminomethyl-2-thiouridine)(34)-methyltransferase MnmD [Fluviicola sp.]|jgi:tRNA U34 5-methylaminomethyl-2-thiouridine-forming methyltransferase MnmC
MKREIRETADGSKTIYLPELDEHYHSSHGALQEAQHVFIKYGLSHCSQDYLTILEMGYGTGLNALLTYFASEKRNQYIHYIAIEAFPPTEEEWRAMEYHKHNPSDESLEVFEKMNLAPWNQVTSLSEHFVIEKRQVKFEELDLKAESVDLIFYDAFGPRVQPDLWTLERFQDCYNWLTDEGVFVTYCAKGQVKRDLKTAGFKLEALPGPPGKREMTRGFK